MKNVRAPNESELKMLNSILAPFGIKVDKALIKMLQKNEVKSGVQERGEKVLLSIKEVTEAYSLSRWVVYRAIRSGNLENSIKLGSARSNKVLIPKIELEKWLSTKILNP